MLPSLFSTSSTRPSTEGASTRNESAGASSQLHSILIRAKCLLSSLSKVPGCPHLDTHTAPFPGEGRPFSRCQAEAGGQPRGKMKMKARSVWKCHHTHQRTAPSLAMFSLTCPHPNLQSGQHGVPGQERQRRPSGKASRYTSLPSPSSQKGSLSSSCPAPTQTACGTSDLRPQVER